MTTHHMFDGRLQVYKRENSQVWQAAARVGERRFRQTTGEEDLSRAKDVAEEWYLGLRGKLRNGEIVKDERTFKSAAALYLREMRVLAVSLRSPKYVEGLELRLNRHLLPFFGDKPLSAINRGLVQAYRVKRAEETIARTKTDTAPGKPPARSTMMQEIVHLRQVLKCAEGMGWLPYVPDLNPPHTRPRAREATAPGSPRKNTSSSTPPRVGARSTTAAGAGAIAMRTCTTSCCSWPTRGFGRTKRCGSNFET
jgi:hypothetical protein